MALRAYTIIALVPALLISYTLATDTQQYHPEDEESNLQRAGGEILMVNGRPDWQRQEALQEWDALRVEAEGESEEETDPPPDMLTDEDYDYDDAPDKVPARDGSRKKRFVIKSSRQMWDHGILPYKFHESLPDDYKKNILNYVIPKYEYWTHFRFVEWDPTVPAAYNLTHHNYLLFAKKGGCWSMIGCHKTRKNGQMLSCCKSNACVHEIGHSIGFFHEQSNPIRDDYIHINYQNIVPGRSPNFFKKSPAGSRAFGYFDMGSIMEYGAHAFTKNAKATIVPYDPDMAYLLNHHDGTAFYMFYEAQELYGMKEQMCPDFPLECENGGYVSYINNTCRCRCTAGMDDKTGCATPLNSDIWPEGEYSIPKTQQGCPAGFHDGEIRLWKNDKSRVSTMTSSRSYHASAQVTKNHVTLQFCTKMYSTMPGTATRWPQGSYCIHTTGTHDCPSGFTWIAAESSYPGQFSHLTKLGMVPDITFNGQLNMSMCCRNDGLASSRIVLPIEKPFMLMKYNENQTQCQLVSGTTLREEYISLLGIGHASIKTELTFCFYEPTTGSKVGGAACGDMIHLSDINPSVEVTSPEFPMDYTGNKTCSWFVMVPPGSKVILNIGELDIQSTDRKTCNGHIEVRYVLPGQPGVTYCGKGFDKTIVSNVNSIALILSRPQSRHKRFLLSSESGSHPAINHATRRFNATFQLLRDADLCYTNGGKDNSYQGRVNYGHNFERCLAWDKVINCPHNTFNVLDHDLEANYARNPGYGTEPWCYTDGETCSRAYCDSCQIRRCFDLFADCSKMIIDNPNYCTDDPEALRGCRNTCNICNSVPKSAPISSTRCSVPPAIPDGTLVSNMSTAYSVGYTVTYRCNTDYNMTRQRTCTSEGTWSNLAYVCGDCQVGWHLFGDHCYRYINKAITWSGAATYCPSLIPGAVMTSAGTRQESLYINSLIGNARIWLAGNEHATIVNNTLVWNEGVVGNQTHVDNATTTRAHGRKRCIIKTVKAAWFKNGCTGRNTLVCRTRAQLPTVCADQRPDCQLLLERTPDICETYRQRFAVLKCRKSCGLCTPRGEDAHRASCSITTPPTNASLVTGHSQYIAGDVARYRCDSDYRLYRGHLTRACLLNGTFTGMAPVCRDKNDVVTEVGHSDLRRGLGSVHADFVYFLDNPANTVNRTGVVTAWQFYSIHSGTVALQVWRKAGNTSEYTLVGQNIINDTLDDRQCTVSVTNLEQIRVQPTDFLGMYFPHLKRGVIAFSACRSQYSPEGRVSERRVPGIRNVRGWVLGRHYRLNPRTTCKIFSLRAVIAPS